MNFIEWEDSYSVFVPEMDEQHKRLIKILNDLHDAMTKGRSRQQLGITLSNLVRYTNSHFVAEEKFMEGMNFGQFRLHVAKHRKLTEQVMDYKRRFDADEAISAVELLEFLRDWLVQHILQDDRMYGEQYRRQTQRAAMAK